MNMVMNIILEVQPSNATGAVPALALGNRRNRCNKEGALTMPARRSRARGMQKERGWGGLLGGLQGCGVREGRTGLAPSISPSLASGKEQDSKTLRRWSCP